MSPRQRWAAFLAVGALCLSPSLLLHAAQEEDDPAGDIAEHVLSNAPGGDVEAALTSFNAYSEGKGLGMNLGQEKGDLLQIAVAQGLPEVGPAAVLEMGCHAGDGTLNAIMSLLSRPGSILVGTEGNPRWLDAAMRITMHALDQHDIRFAPLIFNDEERSFDGLLDDMVHHGVSKFNVVIFDHNEKLFLPHLKTLLQRNMLAEGAIIYVDNVKRKETEMRDYLGFVHTASKKGFTTVTKPISKPYPDAVAISTYVGATAEL